MSATTPFFGILTRNFVTSWMDELSRCAVRVYSYLRSWCISPAGQASDWKELRVERISAALDWSVRYVRKGLAELVEKGLIERRPQFVPLSDGTHAQGPNLWRILPEVDATPVPAPISEPTPTPEPQKNDEETDPLFRDEAAAVVAEVPTWASAVLEDLSEEIAIEREGLKAVEKLDPTDRWTVLSAEQLAELAAAHHAKIAQLQHRSAEVEGGANLPATVAAATVWYRQVVLLTMQRVVDLLRNQGHRDRTIARRVSLAIVDANVRRYLLDQGAFPPDRLPAA